MEKSCNSSADSASSTVTTVASSGKDGSSDRPYRLKQHLGLNKLSHRISKQPTSTLTWPEPAVDHQHQNHLLPSNLHQPPVYNINKNDFREVVQKLTGSPAHERISSSSPAPPTQPQKPPTSRLQRIRPPPLPLPNSTALASLLQPPAQPTSSSIGDTSASIGVAGGFNPIGQAATAPFSPLPPLPSVHVAAESPVSAYLRYLQSSVSLSGEPIPFLSSIFPPAVNTLTPGGSAPGVASPAPPQFQQPFGCLNSPRSPYPLLSSGLLFSPSSSQLGFLPQIPQSPTVPMLSPRYRGCI